MKLCDRVRKIYRRDPDAPLVWQPRLEHWFRVNQREGTMPERYRGLPLSAIYDELGASVRYLWSPVGIETVRSPQVKYERVQKDGVWCTRWQAQGKELIRMEKITWDSRMTVKYPVENLDDLHLMQYILSDEQYEFDRETYERAVAEIGDRGVPTIILPRINLQRLFIDIMGYERTVFFLHDYPKEMESFIRAIDEAGDRYCATVKDTPFELINFGDNVHCDMLPPYLFERYVFPRYQKMCDLFHAAGKFCFPHWDGNVRYLMPYSTRCGFDAIEAVTFHPQGDVSMEEWKEATGDLILVDGLPAVIFLPEFPQEEFLEYTRRVIETFRPDLVLGISDELPPHGDIERCRLVSSIVAEYGER